MKPTAELENYSIEKWSKNEYYLIGNVYNHIARPDLKDGCVVRTSKLIRIDFEKLEAETLNTIYKLK